MKPFNEKKLPPHELVGQPPRRLPERRDVPPLQPQPELEKVAKEPRQPREDVQEPLEE